MRDRAACTVVSKQTLPLARVLARSFLAQHPDVPFFTLLADDVQGRFDPSQEPGAVVDWSSMPLPWRDRLKMVHPQHALTCAAAPLLIDHLFDAGFRRVLFLKQESLVLSRLDSLFDALTRHSVIVTPHAGQPIDADDGESRELMFLRSGIYNVGVFGATASARPFIQWWRDRTAEHCRLAVQKGLHYEQRWIDFAPAFVPDLGVLRDPAVNVGHWSLPMQGLAYEAGRLCLNGRPCLVFRFSGLSADSPQTVTKYYSRLQPDDISGVWPLFTHVRTQLEREGWDECSRWPFAFDTFDNGLPVPPIVRRLYIELGERADDFGDPLRTGVGSFFDALTLSARPASHSAITRFWQWIYDQRTDLQQVYPDVHGSDVTGFLGWTREYGWREAGLTPEFAEAMAR